MNSEFYEKLKEVCGNVKPNEPMSKHTTFKIGGAADYYASPSSIDEVANVVELCKKENVPYTVIGNGSNILVKDGGIEGVVLNIAICDLEIEGKTIKSGAGVLLSKTANAALGKSLSGLEFAAGIPGNIGGGIYMNAGAYGGEMKDVVKSVTYIDEDGSVRTATAEELGFAYRKSKFTGTKCIILSCELELDDGDYDEIKQRMNELAAKRSDKQPLSMPSAGSTFKRPDGYFAGGLIEQAGLKGFSVGGAQVSEKHAGFIVNKGGATATDVESLIKHIQKIVREKFSVELEPEVKIIGKEKR